MVRTMVQIVSHRNILHDGAICYMTRQHVERDPIPESAGELSICQSSNLSMSLPLSSIYDEI
jgi:hypothetical protein